MRTGTLLLALLALVAGSMATDPADTLHEVRERILDSSGVMTLSTATLQDEKFGPFLNVVLDTTAGLKLTNASCTLTSGPEALQCRGTLGLWGNTPCEAQVVIALLTGSQAANSALQLAGSLSLAASKGWDPSSHIPNFPSGSWMEDLAWEDVSGKLVLASTSFAAAGSNFNEGITFVLGDVTVASGKDLLGLSALLTASTVASLKFTLTTHIPISNAIDPSGVSSVLDLNAVLPVGKAGVVTTDGLNVTAVDLTKSPSLTLAALVHVAAPRNPTLTFSGSGSWSASSSQLVLSGALVGDWPHPFGYDFLTVTAAKASVTISTSASAGPLLAAFSASGTGDVSDGAKNYTGGFSVGASDDYADLQLTLSLSETLPPHTSVAHWLHLSSSAPSLLKDVTVVDAAGKLVLSTYAFGGNVPGVNLYGTVKLNEASPTADMLSRALGDAVATTNLGLTVQLQDSGAGLPTKLEDVLVKLTADSIPVDKRLTLTNCLLSMNAQPAVDVTVKAATDLAVLFNESAPAVTFSTSASFDSASTSLSWKGALVGSWPQPMGVDWLTITSANAAVTFDLGASGSAPGLSSFSVSGGASVAAHTHTYTGGFSFSLSNDYQDIQLTLDFTDTIDAGQLVTAALHLSASADSVLQGVTFDSTGAKLVLSTYAFGGNVRGFNLYGTAKTTESSPMGQLLSPLGATAMQTDWKATLQLADSGSGIAVGTLSQVTVALSASALPVSSSVSLSDTSLTFTAVPATSVSISAATGITLKMKGQPAPLQFTTSASWSSSASTVTFMGALNSEWEHPFHADWLNLTSAELALSASYGASPGISQLAIAGQGSVKFAHDPTAIVGLDFQALDSFTQLGLQVSVDVDDFKTPVKVVTGKDSYDSADQLEIVGGKVTVTLCNMAWTAGGASFLPGITVSTTVKATGDLATTMKPLMAYDPTHTFGASLYLAEAGNEVKLTLTTSSLPINSDITMDGLALSLSLGQPTAVSLSTGFTLTHPKHFNGPATFNIAGSLAASGQISLQGGMEGKWMGLYGIDDLVVDDVWIKVALGPTGLSGFGCGGTLQFGPGGTTVSVDGYYDPTMPSSMFMYVSISKLSLKGVATDYNNIVPSGWPKLDTHHIPDIISFSDVKVTLAPEDGSLTVDGQTYTWEAGIYIGGYYDIAGVKKHASAHCGFGNLVMDFTEPIVVLAPTPRLRGALPAVDM